MNHAFASVLEARAILLDKLSFLQLCTYVLVKFFSLSMELAAVTLGQPFQSFRASSKTEQDEVEWNFGALRPIGKNVGGKMF